MWVSVDAKKFNTDDLIYEISEALVGNIDEPAGSGAGYSITQEGLDEIDMLIRDFIGGLQ